MSQWQSQSQSRSSRLQQELVTDRPLLARVADSLFWMSRYAERAEHISRVLLINANLLIDMGELEPMLLDAQWSSLPGIFLIKDCEHSEDIAACVLQKLAIDRGTSSNLYDCVSRARENARAVRSEISAEMWTSLNTLYWSVQASDTLEERREEFLSEIMRGSLHFQGLTDQTLAHDQRWLFIQLGKLLERASVTCRIVSSRFAALENVQDQLELPIRNIQWMAVLRMCCSIEAYRRQFVGDLDPERVLAFVVLEVEFPRSIRFCVDEALRSISAIRQLTSPAALDQAERILGRLSARLAYADTTEIFASGAATYLDSVLSDLNAAASAVQQTYFLK